MAKNNGREVAKRLTQEIAATKDPETLIRLTTQLAKFQPKKRRQSKSESKPDEKPNKKHSPILDTRTGSMVDNLSDGEKVLQYLVGECEKRERKTGQKLTHTERDTFYTELISSLSERERAAFEALNTDEVG